MPPRQQGKTPSNEELFNALNQVQTRMTENHNNVMDRLDRMDAAIADLTNLVRQHVERATAVETTQSLRVYQGETIGNRIPRPSNLNGKTGFFQYLQAHLAENDQHNDLYLCVNRAALVSVQSMRNAHGELEFVGWGGLGHDYKLEMAENTLEIALQEYNVLDVIRRCHDLWPCLIILQTKWTQMSAYQRRQR